MAEIKWTDAQLTAISEKDKNILVSAAAGSGKTAVLVERVIRMISDEESQVSLDSLLIMTFTKAAAAQMKEKICKKIRAAIKENPDNEHLKKQLFSASNARICTIDSLCMDIVRENFHAVDIDPGFRIADESEILLLQKEVLSELIEEQYKDPSEGFLQFVNFYTDKSDSKLDEIILTLYNFAQSYPEPEKWIRNCIEPYRLAAGLEADAEYSENSWMLELKEIIETELGSIKSLAETGCRISQMNYGPDKYTPLFEEIMQFIDSISGEDKIFDLRGEAIAEIVDNWKRTPNIYAKDGVDEKLKNAALNIRKEIKERLVSLRETFFAKDLEGSYKDMALCAQVAQTIADLAVKFGKNFQAAKRDKNIADFNDIAHLALEILIEHDETGCIKTDAEGAPVYTDAADSMAQDIKEIIVDEYQDTNMLQEYIIGALSTERFGRPDIFMVGDVKQSIYGFRMACPELFSGKYDAYAEENAQHKRILLNSNFRSRKEVIDLVNDVFSQSMIRGVGGIEYTDGHKLNCAAVYPKAESEEQYIPEILFIDESGRDGKTAEGYKIAARINELVENELVTDEKSGRLRKANYGDIAILTRSSDNPEIEQALDEKNIPVIKASNKGFFESFEIRMVLDLLEIIDNPYQDILFTAVITGPLVGIDSNTLARIKLSYSSAPFSMYLAAASFEKDAALSLFMEKLSAYQKKAKILTAPELMEYVLHDSGLLNMITAMPGGESRRANIELLKEKAVSYSKGSLSGLFDFLRYIKQLKEADKDFGQAQVFSEDIQAVRMMTIHKSKGLEFPIVIIANAAKDYNRNDLNRSIVLNRKMGLGIELRNPVERTVSRTLIMETIRAAGKRELYAEEMRLLYVAMTRAKEKLIITGSGKGMQKAAERWCQELYRTEPQLDGASILSSSGFLKLLGRTLIRHRDFEKIANICGYEAKDIKSPDFLTSRFEADMIEGIDAEEERAEELQKALSLDDEINEILDKCDEDKVREISERISCEYKYTKATEKELKITASALEKHDTAYNGADINKAFKNNKSQTGLSGAERGNAYHKFFELVDYGDQRLDGYKDKDSMTAFSKEMIETLYNDGMLDEEHKDVLDPEKTAQFLLSDIAGRMKSAFDKGLLKREQQFVMGYVDEDGDERLIQGIIDAFFEESGNMVLVDYKTDRNIKEEQFIRTYKDQLNAYADAIEKATGKPVTEKYIYSLELGRTIAL